MSRFADAAMFNREGLSRGRWNQRGSFPQLQSIALGVRGTDHDAAFTAKIEFLTEFIDVLFNGAAGNFTAHAPDCGADCFA